MAHPLESRRLSSRLTGLYQYGVPAFLGVWLIGVFSVVFQREGEAPRLEIVLILLLSTVALVYGYYRMLGRLKHVELEGDQLIVRGFGQEAQIPLREISAVGGSRFTNPERIWLDIRIPSHFGSRIVFLPKQRLFHFASVHPLVEELRALIADGSETGWPASPPSPRHHPATVVTLVLIGAAVFGLLLTTFVVSTLRSSAPYAMGLHALRSDAAVIELLGEPIEPGWWVWGSLKRSGRGGWSDLHFPISGPDRAGRAAVSATSVEGRWQLNHVSLVSGERELTVVGRPGSG